MSPIRLQGQPHCSAETYVMKTFLCCSIVQFPLQYQVASQHPETTHPSPTTRRQFPRSISGRKTVNNSFIIHGMACPEGVGGTFHRFCAYARRGPVLCVCV